MLTDDYIDADLTQDDAVVWYRNDNTLFIAIEENFTFADNQRLKTGNYSLKIVNANVFQHDGFYHCEYVGTLPNANSTKAEVTVVVAAKVNMTLNDVDVTDLPELTLKANDKREEFRCVAKYANPEPNITWFLDSEYITNSTIQEGSEMSILNHAFEAGKGGADGAVLQCKVFVHELLEVQSVSKKLNVKYMMHRFDFQLHPDGDALVFGKDAVIECAADGNPEPGHFNWSKNGKKSR